MTTSSLVSDKTVMAMALMATTRAATKSDVAKKATMKQRMFFFFVIITDRRHGVKAQTAKVMQSKYIAT